MRKKTAAHSVFQIWSSKSYDHSGRRRRFSFPLNTVNEDDEQGNSSLTHSFTHGVKITAESKYFSPFISLFFFSRFHSRGLRRMCVCERERERAKGWSFLLPKNFITFCPRIKNSCESSHGGDILSVHITQVSWMDACMCGKTLQTHPFVYCYFLKVNTILLWVTVFSVWQLIITAARRFSAVALFQTLLRALFSVLEKF